jgi:hypothetical protein
MTSVTAKRFVCGAMTLWALDSTSSLQAQTGIGTWVQQRGASGTGALTMTVEACCNGGRRLIYRIESRGTVVMTVDSPMDGREAPVLVGGKPSGETMAIKLVDDHHTITVLRMDGKPFGTSKATLSADGKTLTVENEVTSAAGGQTPGKTTEVWVRK